MTFLKFTDDDGTMLTVNMGSIIAYRPRLETDCKKKSAEVGTWLWTSAGPFKIRETASFVMQAIEAAHF